MNPSPGTATLDDLIATNESKERGAVCEWVEGTLVEKPIGQRESWVTFIIIGELYAYLQSHDVGMFLGPDGVMKILPGIGRAPDVAFLAWGSLPGVESRSLLRPGCPTPAGYGPGRLDDYCSAHHFWSLHPGGADWLFADGSVRFMSYAAAPLLPALATRAGGEVVDASAY